MTSTVRLMIDDPTPSAPLSEVQTFLRSIRALGNHPDALAAIKRVQALVQAAPEQRRQA